MEIQVNTSQNKSVTQQLLQELSNEEHVYQERLKGGLYIYQQLCYVLVAVILLHSQVERCVLLERVLEKCQKEGVSFLEIIGK